MPDPQPQRHYRFGTFEVDAAGGELLRNGLRAKLHAQPFQLLLLLLQRPGEIVTREEICRELWPDGTFVDYEHGVNSALNRLRAALGDKAANPRFVETVARRGYRFIAPVKLVTRAEPEREPEPEPEPEPRLFDRVLAAREELPQSSHTVVRTLFLLLQVMYLAFYLAGLANLRAIGELLAPLPLAAEIYIALIATAALLIPVRAFLLSATLFRAPGIRPKFLKIWPFLLPFDALWSLAPFLLLHHIDLGVALACTTLLVYSPFAQRSLILMM